VTASSSTKVTLYNPPPATVVVVDDPVVTFVVVVEVELDVGVGVGLEPPLPPPPPPQPAVAAAMLTAMTTAHEPLLQRFIPHLLLRATQHATFLIAEARFLFWASSAARSARTV